MALVPVSEWKDSLQSFRELLDRDAGRGTNLPELENILVFIIKISIIILFFGIDHLLTVKITHTKDSLLTISFFSM